MTIASRYIGFAELGDLRTRSFESLRLPEREVFLDKAPLRHRSSPSSRDDPLNGLRHRDVACSFGSEQKTQNRNPLAHTLLCSHECPGFLGMAGMTSIRSCLIIVVTPIVAADSAWGSQYAAYFGSGKGNGSTTPMINHCHAN